MLRHDPHTSEQELINQLYLCHEWLTISYVTIYIDFYNNTQYYTINMPDFYVVVVVVVVFLATGSYSVD